MNEQLQQALAAILQSSLKAVQAGASVAQAELPEVVRQLLLWKAVESAFQFMLGAGMAYVAIRSLRAFWRAFQDGPPWNDNEPGYVLGGIGAIFLCILSLFLVSCNLDWLHIMIAPKAYMLEYAANLIKK